MASAFIIGGTGQIGIAVARRLAEEGWAVRLGSRTPPPVDGPWQHVPFDRSDPDALKTAIGEGADLLMDCIAFDEADADGLLSAQASVGHIIAVSSASVYRDEQGRTLDEAGERGFPRLPVPIREDQPTVDPGPGTYSTRKAAMERRLLDRAQCRATILRPAAIHGPYSKHAREWWFVRRLLDGRQRIPLAYGGRSRFQTTSVAAIAEAVVWTVAEDRPSILNVADANAPTAAEIGGAIMAAMERSAEIVGLSDEPYPPSAGMSPWSVAGPFVCSSLAPNAGTYAQTVRDAVIWLIEATRGRDWRSILPQLAAYPWDLFDYEGEDRVLSAAR
ncbi:NAD-dependent epimerase/dehydratase family protein [Sinorhizobium sp. 7-81]|uniref:NAD-dependent epimerase/dehydratase family protein n=1 Tax=Sinorhizobium sp. 8-89 TaxID=3049089 RepID=UPI0024C271F5|nr:NAD-dependent epimerase/dehydratase family protein [Sinorhizobium sp. 8-89]MDK1489726.1 NAD-dependent epimerase/dehydratase family protein [Sinorhizobium sp. 8-89]